MMQEMISSLSSKNKLIGQIMLKICLKSNSFSLGLIDRLSVILNNGIHPKHDIIKYKEWFLSNIKPDWVVVDIGCNTGLMPYILASKAKFVYGLEIEARHINEAKLKRQRENIEYICCDATKYDFRQLKEVNCITLSNVLEHIDKRIEFLRTLLKNVRWTEEKAKFFLIRVPMIDRDWLVLYKKQKGMEYRSDNTHFTEYTLEGFQEELRQAGIKILNHEIKFGEIHAVCQSVN